MARVVFHVFFALFATVALAVSETSDIRGEYLPLPASTLDGLGVLKRPDPPELPEDSAQTDEDYRPVPDKRSAVETALKRKARRRPAPRARALPAAPAAYINVDLFGDQDQLMHSVLDVVRLLASPKLPEGFFRNPPDEIQRQAARGESKAYNRRTYEKIAGVYPAANGHDPRLLWIGLGR